jgi:pyruvate/2-oxoglutarate dehydrogenase complex dihydrolipoamide acyltransferase (E2) component
MATYVFVLPDLGEGLENAEIIEWKVVEGAAVEINQPLVDVQTAKAIVEIPSPVAGIATKLHAIPGAMVEVGAALATFEIRQHPETAGNKRSASPPPVLVGYGVKEERPADNRRPRLQPPTEGLPPLLRRLAQRLGVDMSTVKGTGPKGRVTREDIVRAAASGSGKPATLPGPEERIPVRGIRRAVAEKMVAAWTQIPHATTFLTLDATALETFRSELAARAQEKVSPLPVVVRCLVEICRSHRLLNASFRAETLEIVLKRVYHVGIATETDQGVVVPVVRDADTKGILTIAHEIAALTQRARAQRAKPEDLTGSTITITNAGSFGAEFGTPIINTPEAAILSLGVIESRALIVDGRVEPRPATTLGLSFDHRVLDGAEAGRALLALRGLLSDLERLRALPWQ